MTAQTRSHQPLIVPDLVVAQSRPVPVDFVLGVATAAYQIEGPVTRTAAPTRSGTPSATTRVPSSTATRATSRASTTTGMPPTWPS